MVFLDVSQLFRLPCVKVAKRREGVEWEPEWLPDPERAEFALVAAPDTPQKNTPQCEVPHKNQNGAESLRIQ